MRGPIAFTQCSDLWEERDFPGLIARLESDGLWTRSHISEPKQYLPGNTEFRDEIKVIHTLCIVS